MLAEAANVPRTGLNLCRRINVEVQTLGVGALAVLGKEPALGHFL